MSEGEDRTSKDATDDFWKTQYELLSNWQIGEADRFWTRFQISLALNGGLLVAYSAIFGIKSEELVNRVTTLIGPLAISAVGIVLSVIWHLISDAGAKWQDYWVDKGIEIEKAYSKVRIFSDIKAYEKEAPVRKIRAAIPILFLITWAILFMLILLPLLTPILDDVVLGDNST